MATGWYRPSQFTERLTSLPNSTLTTSQSILAVHCPAAALSAKSARSAVGSRCANLQFVADVQSLSVCSPCLFAAYASDFEPAGCSSGLEPAVTALCAVSGCRWQFRRGHCGRQLAVESLGVLWHRGKWSCCCSCYGILKKNNFLFFVLGCIGSTSASVIITGGSTIYVYIDILFLSLFFMFYYHLNKLSDILLSPSNGMK